MPTIDDLKNTKTDIDFFDKLLGRAEKFAERHPDSEELEFVQSIIKLYARRGDGLYISDADLERLTKIANGDAKFKSKPAPKPKKAVRKVAKKAKAKAKAKKAKKPVKKAKRLRTPVKRARA